MPNQNLLKNLIAKLDIDYIQKVSQTSLVKIIIIILGFIITVIISRSLGSEGQGTYAVAMTLGAIGIQFGNLGLHASNTYFVAKEPTLLPKLVSNTLVVGILLGGICGTAFGLTFYFIPQVSLLPGPILLLSLLWIPAGLNFMLFQSLLLGIHEVTKYNKIEFANKALTAAFIILLLASGHLSIAKILIVSLTALTFCAIWSFVHLRRRITGLPQPDATLFQKNIQYGIKAYLAALFAFLVIRADLLMIKHLLSAQEAGYYSIAATFIDFIILFPVVMANILFPKLTSYPTNEKKAEKMREVFVQSAFVMAALVLLGMFLIKHIIPFLFGQEFIPAIPPFLWLLPGIFFLGIEIVMVQYLNSIGFPKVIVVIWALAFLLNIVLNLRFIPTHGIVGAAFVSSISYFLAFLLIFIKTKKYA